MTADDFAFSRDSELWLVNRYANGLLFGPAAVLLQVAHPRVAQGVADHSDFREDALGRLRRTLSTVNQIAFGTKEAAEKMRARLRVVHGGVNGAISEGMAEPKNYSAFEPDLLMWVLATLIDASIKGYEFVWEPLSGERRENFYRDFRRFGTYFGLGEEVGPQGYIEFEKYYDEMLSGDLLGSHPLCAEVAAAVVWPKKPWRDRMLGKAGDFLPLETLPAMIRERLGLESTGWSRGRMKILQKVAPVAFRSLPKWVTYYPESYRAEMSMED